MIFRTILVAILFKQSQVEQNAHHSDHQDDKDSAVSASGSPYHQDIGYSNADSRSFSSDTSLSLWRNVPLGMTFQTSSCGSEDDDTITDDGGVLL